MAKSAVEKYGSNGAKVLVHLRRHGKIILCPSEVPHLPEGMDVSDVVRILQALKVEGILNEDFVHHNVSPQRIWTIAPALEEPFDELLYPASISESTQK
jgi:hypothetical protein